MRSAHLAVFALVLALSACTTTKGHHRRHHREHPDRPTTGSVEQSEQPSGPRPGEHYNLGSVEPLPTAANVPAGQPLPAPAADAPPAHMRVHLIDVGQGLSILLEFSCAAVLVDTGGETNDLFDSGRALSSYLTKFFVTRPDLHRTLALLVLTHPHKDHTLNAEMVAKGFTIQNVVTDGLAEGSGGREQVWLQDFAESHHIPLFKVDADQIPKGGLTNAVIDPVRCADLDPELSVLWGAPAPGKEPASWSARDVKSGNNYSVALRVGFGKSTVLSTGDAEGAALHEMIVKHAGTDAVNSGVWVVSHHGSEHGATEEFISATTPAIALLATGSPERQIRWSAWDYGHPRIKVVEMLEQAVVGERPEVDLLVADGAKSFMPHALWKAIYATGWDGSVLVEVDSDGMARVKTTK